MSRLPAPGQLGTEGHGILAHDVNIATHRPEEEHQALGREIVGAVGEVSPMHARHRKPLLLAHAEEKTDQPIGEMQTQEEETVLFQIAAQPLHHRHVPVQGEE